MSSNIATVVNWYGPYTGTSESGTLASAKKAAESDWASGKGLYAAIGPGEANRRGPRKLLYMGVGNPLHSRLTPNHHQLKKLVINSLWLGEIGVPGIPGRKSKKIDAHLDIAEWASVFFMELPFNVKKRYNPPNRSFVVVNRWWETDYETPCDKPLSGWPDVIEYDKDRERANMAWFAPRRRIKTVMADAIRRPRPDAVPGTDE